jgi:hypothetical protein
VRVLAHIKKLDDCFGQFLVRVSCACGASRHIEPEALARLVGWSTTLKALCAAAALFAVRQEGRGGRGSGEAQATGIAKNPH